MIYRFIIFFLLISQLSFGQGSPYKFSEQIILNFKNDKTSRNDIAAWDFSFIGEYKQLLKMWDTCLYNDSIHKQYPFFSNKTIPTTRKDSLYLSLFKPVKAIDYLKQNSKSEKIIIINEAHHQPRHRVFTTSLLQSFYDNGFRYLGLETLSWADTLLNQRKYPLLKSGFYTIEPQFGDLVRTALEIGYIVFPYETKDTAIGKQREINQAKNIAQILKKDSTAKILIHCGFAHNVETYYGGWEKAMAGRLIEYTGINPLTISQTEMTETSSTEFDNPFFRIINLDYDAIFIDSLGQTFNGSEGNNRFDIEVYHPRTKWINGRPDWIFSQNKIPVSVPSKITTSYPCLVFAFKENESINNSVPFDVIELKSKSDKKRLSLKKGTYVIIIKDTFGKKQEFKIKL